MRSLVAIAFFAVLGFAAVAAYPNTAVKDNESGLGRYVSCAVDVYREFAKYYLGPEGIFMRVHQACREHATGLTDYAQCMYNALAPSMSMDVYAMVVMYQNCLATGKINPDGEDM